MNRKRVFTIGSIILGILLVVFLFCYGAWKKEKLLEKKEREEHAREEQGISYGGETYEYNYNLRNVLFIGVDKSDELREHEAGWAGQADCLILLSMDKDKQETTLLEISRDAMTDVETYGENDTYLGTQRMQIAAQYAYGDGQKRSCQLVTSAVSNLLYEIPIHSYVALSVDGIAKITELMGGVTITVPKDYTAIDPQFQEGATLNLKGEQAERYVRYRDKAVTGSNSERMERQTQFLEALALQSQGKSVSWYQNLQAEAEEYIVTDLTLDEMDRLSRYPMNKEIQMVPGEVQQGEKYDEFIVDSEKLKEIVIKLFYKSEN